MEAKEATRTSIRSAPLFRDVSAEHWNLLQGKVQDRRIAKGEVVVEQGTEALEMFVIIDGEYSVEVRQEGLDLVREVSRLKPGDFFGEVGLLTGGARTASVKALSDGRALVLHHKDLKAVMAEAPEVAMAICRGLASRLQEIQSNQVAVNYVSLSAYPDAASLIHLIPVRTSRIWKAVALEETGDHVRVGAVDPYDPRARTFLRDVLRPRTVEFSAISAAEYDAFAEKYLVSDNFRIIEDGELAEVAFVNDAGKAQPLGDGETGSLLQEVFRAAIRHGASDLHFEPGESAGVVRMRVDGNMMEARSDVPVPQFSRMLSRLKVMSEMDITIKRMPQDGRFRVAVGDRRIELRSSTTPCQGGEKAVLRVLDRARQKLALGDLILSRPLCGLVSEAFNSPSGLFLVTGPTGSGKTTTLYAGLHDIWNTTQTVNMVTIEDPVEYDLEFAAQIQVNRHVGLDFAQILRTTLRQDPDIILVGEIRDPESAAIALEAATTGHLVLSSLHTDFALESLVRLRRLEVKSYLVGAALKGVVSQRLVPRVCQNCAEEFTDDAVTAGLRRAGVIDAKETIRMVRGKGCDVCRNRGELGRVGVYEVLMVDEALREMIEREASWAEMHGALTAEKFVSMQRYARFLLADGVVSPEAVLDAFPAQVALKESQL